MNFEKAVQCSASTLQCEDSAPYRITNPSIISNKFLVVSFLVVSFKPS